MACILTAHPDIICRSHEVPCRTIREVLEAPRHRNSRQWQVPVFQRRYCWGTAQLRRLLHDVVDVCTLSPAVLTEKISTELGGRRHDMGRIVVAEIDDFNYLIIDGQQRLTTVGILLSSIRDFLVYNEFICPMVASSALALIDRCNSVLITKSGSPVLVPSFFDRHSYASCVASTTAPKQSDGEADTDCVLKARRLFDSLLGKDHQLLYKILRKIGRRAADGEGMGLLSEEEICTAANSLVAAILDKLQVYLFVVQEGDVESIYERLALREALVARSAYNNAPGVCMAECDLVRNFIISYFRDDSAKLDAYLRYWVPLESTVLEEIRQEVGVAQDHTEVVASMVTGSEHGQVIGTVCKTAAEAVLGQSTRTSASTRTAMLTADSLLCCDPPEVSGRVERMNELLLRFAQSKKMVPAQASANESQSSPLSVFPSVLDLWVDPGSDSFPAYGAVKACVYDTLCQKGLAVRLSESSPMHEVVVSGLLEELLLFVQTLCSATDTVTAAASFASSDSVVVGGGVQLMTDSHNICDHDDGDNDDDVFNDGTICGVNDMQTHALAADQGKSWSTVSWLGSSATRSCPATASSICPCVLHGTLCTDCIVKKYAK